MKKKREGGGINRDDKNKVDGGDKEEGTFSFLLPGDHGHEADCHWEDSREDSIIGRDDDIPEESYASDVGGESHRDLVMYMNNLLQ